MKDMFFEGLMNSIIAVFLLECPMKLSLYLSSLTKDFGESVSTSMSISNGFLSVSTSGSLKLSLSISYAYCFSKAFSGSRAFKFSIRLVFSNG
jgi:hypothetical protein